MKIDFRLEKFTLVLRHYYSQKAIWIFRHCWFRLYRIESRKFIYDFFSFLQLLFTFSLQLLVLQICRFILIVIVYYLVYLYHFSFYLFGFVILLTLFLILILLFMLWRCRAQQISFNNLRYWLKKRNHKIFLRWEKKNCTKINKCIHN